MSSIDTSAENNYINGLKINGDLTVKGTLYVPQNKNNCPDSLLNTPLKNIELESTIFDGNLHLHPNSTIEVTGKILSNNFQSEY